MCIRDRARDDAHVNHYGDRQLAMIGVAAPQCFDDGLGRAAGVVINKEQQQRPAEMIGRLENTTGADSRKTERRSGLAGRKWLGHATIVV